MVFWEEYASDEAMGTFAPIVVYWLYAGLYELLPPLDGYRLHTRKEEKVKNSVPLASVIKGVLLQQFFQATVAHGLFLVSSFNITYHISLKCDPFSYKCLLMWQGKFLLGCCSKNLYRLNGYVLENSHE